MDLNRLKCDEGYCNHLLEVIYILINKEKIISSFDIDDEIKLLHELTINRYDRNDYFEIVYTDETHLNWESLYSTYKFNHQGRYKFGNIRITVNSNNLDLYKIEFLPIVDEHDINIHVPFQVDCFACPTSV